VSDIDPPTDDHDDAEPDLEPDVEQAERVTGGSGKPADGKDS
jgi:hypothetical protein